MKFRTEINIPPVPFQITHRDKITVLGSCFAGHTGSWLREHWWNVVINPFGNVYNPLSWFELLERVWSNRPPGEENIFFHNNQWKSLLLPSMFNTSCKQDYLNQAKALFANVRERLQQTDVLILTYGTAQVFRHVPTESIVVNCNKIPSAECRREMLDIPTLNKSISGTIHMLHRFRKDMKIILTLSPVRYLHNGLTANSRSKARLLESILQQVSAHNNTFYFPAYEIFMDDLRDYRFYAADLKQPGEQGIRYTLEKFSSTFLAANTRDLCHRIEKLRSAYLHKPITPTGYNVPGKVKSQIENLLTEHPYLLPDIEI